MRRALLLRELDLVVGLFATVAALCSLGAVATGSLSCCVLFAVNAAIAHQAWLDYARRVAPDAGDDDDDDGEPAVAAPHPVARSLDGARLRIDGVSPVASLAFARLHAAGLGRADVLDIAQAAGFTRCEDASAELRRLMDLCRAGGNYRGAEFARFHAGQRDLAHDEAVFLALVESAGQAAVVCFIGQRA